MVKYGHSTGALIEILTRLQSALSALQFCKLNGKATVTEPNAQNKSKCISLLDDKIGHRVVSYFSLKNAMQEHLTTNISSY